MVEYNVPMESSELQSICELGQQQLMRMEYLQAEATLARAEEIAWHERDLDALSRLYMPLQEARRQRRQRCGEGLIRFDLLAGNADDPISGRRVLEKFPHGQFLICGWGTLGPAIEARKFAAEHGLFADVLLGAVFPAGAGRLVVIVPNEDVRLPQLPALPDAIIAALPAHSIVLSAADLPAATYSSMMDIWERLHAPFLAAADAIAEAQVQAKIQAYRKTIRVDYACELAHQKISDLARRAIKSAGTGAR